MTTLHTLQHSFDDQPWLTRSTESLSPGDGILLLEDAVSICCHLPTLEKLKTLGINISFYAMDVDLKARGLNPAKVPFPLEFQIISYKDFVELS